MANGFKVLPIRSVLELIRPGDASALVGGFRAGIAAAGNRRQLQQMRIDERQRDQQLQMATEEQRMQQAQKAQEMQMDQQAKARAEFAQKAPATFELFQESMGPAMRMTDPVARKNAFRAGLIRMQKLVEKGLVNPVTPMIKEALPSLAPEDEETIPKLLETMHQQTQDAMRAVSSQEDEGPRKLPSSVDEVISEVGAEHGFDITSPQGIQQTAQQFPRQIAARLAAERYSKQRGRETPLVSIDTSPTSSTKSKLDETIRKNEANLRVLSRAEELITGPNGEDLAPKFLGLVGMTGDATLSAVDFVSGDIPEEAKPWFSKMSELKALVNGLNVQILRDMFGSAQTATELQNAAGSLLTMKMGAQRFRNTLKYLQWKMKTARDLAVEARTSPDGVIANVPDHVVGQRVDSGLKQIQVEKARAIAQELAQQKGSAPTRGEVEAEMVHRGFKAAPGVE